MKTFFAVASFLVAAGRAAVIDIASTDPSITYLPNDGKNWDPIAAPGAFDGTGMFLLGPARNEGVITIAPSQPFTQFVFFGYQRSDGGIYGITFDGADASRIDVYNKTAQGGDLPLALFTKSGLANTKHKVVITNLLDSRVGQFGQMNIDHVEISTGAASASSSASSSTTPAGTTSAPPPPTSASSVPPASVPDTDSDTNTSPPATIPSGPVAPVPSSPNGDDDTNSTSPATNTRPNHVAAIGPRLSALGALGFVAAAGLFL